MKNPFLNKFYESQPIRSVGLIFFLLYFSNHWQHMVLDKDWDNWKDLGKKMTTEQTRISAILSPVLAFIRKLEKYAEKLNRQILKLNKYCLGEY